MVQIQRDWSHNDQDFQHLMCFLNDSKLATKYGYCQRYFFVKGLGTKRLYERRIFTDFFKKEMLLASLPLVLLIFRNGLAEGFCFFAAVLIQ